MLMKKAVAVYIYITIIIGVLGRIVPYVTFIGSGINSLIYNLLAVSGAVLLAADFFVTKKWNKGKYVIILYGFIAVMFISSLINIKYGYFDNIKTLVWTTIQIGLFYTFYTRMAKNEVIKFVKSIWIIISGLWFIPIVYSLKQFAFLESYTVKLDDGLVKRQGFVENRLFGIFNDPNYAAITALMIIIASLYFIKKEKKLPIKIYWIVNVIIQYVYIILSGSRTAIVCTILASVAYAVAIVINRRPTLSKVRFWLAMVIVPVASVSVVLLSTNVVQKISVYVPMYMADKDNNVDNQEQIEDEEMMELLEREDAASEDKSNNRFKIWKSYISGLEGDLLFGGSPRNFLQKWIDKEPDGYLSQTNYETHNGYLTVIVATGVVGAMFIFAFFSLFLYKGVKYIFKKRTLDDELILVVLHIIVILAYTFFFTELFFINNITSVLFWTLCGIAMGWVSQEEEK